MRRIWLAAFALSVACYGSQQSACDFGGGPTPIPSTPTPTPTPTQTPTPSPTPENFCLRPDGSPWIDSLRIEGPSVAVKNQATHFGLTPMQNYLKDGFPASRPVPDACNEPFASDVGWVIEGDRTAGIIIGNGFEGILTRLVGGNPPPPITIRVSFRGHSNTKVVM